TAKERVLKLVFLDGWKRSSFGAGPISKDMAFLIQGLVALVITAIGVGIRASGSIAGERENRTWEGLLITPLPSKQLIRGKIWGIIDSARPYLLAYFIPAILVSAFCGPFALYWTLYWWALTWLAIYFMAGTGIE